MFVAISFTPEKLILLLDSKPIPKIIEKNYDQYVHLMQLESVIFLG